MCAFKLDKWKSLRPATEKESDIENLILDYLKRVPGAFFWKDRQVKRKGSIGIRSDQKGIADILGVYRGNPVAFEVKKSDGRLSIEQKEFIKNYQQCGGFAFVVRSLDEVIANLKTIEGGKSCQA